MPEPQPRDCLRFVLNGEVVELRDVDPSMTVLRWLRETRRLTGTKEGCAAGDCGACTVMVGADRSGGGTQYRAVNACLMPLPMLDETVVVTVEHLAADDGTLHPVQRAMVDCHGSQCGFCTPGFVMSMAALHRTAAGNPFAVSVHDIDDALSGNLCRCTGYAPIRKAMVQALSEHAPLETARRTADDQQLERLLKSLFDNELVALEHDGKRAFIPATLKQFASLLITHPDATVIAGATDAGLWINKQHREVLTMIFTARLSDPMFNGMGAGWIGGGVTHADAMAASKQFLGAAGDALNELWRRFAGAQVRNTGTVGGNIANGSPIGDLAPAFIALGAMLHLQRGDDVRTLPLEDFFIAYGHQDRRAGEFVLGLGLREASSVFAVHKVSKRFDDDISAVCGAFNIDVRDGIVRSARIAYGGMAATPKRARAVEISLIGKPWTRASIDATVPIFAHDFQPISDMRASAAYRIDVAKNLLVRTYIEHAEGAAKTRLVGAGALGG